LETPFWNETILFARRCVLRPGPTALDPAHEEVINSRQAVIEQLIYIKTTTLVFPACLCCAYETAYTLFAVPTPIMESRAERYSQGSNAYGWDFRLRKGWLTQPRRAGIKSRAAFIRSLVQGPLNWLGATRTTRRIRESGSARGRYLSVRSGGWFCCSVNRSPTEADPNWGRLIVQPNFDLVALAPVSEVLLLELDRFAERGRLELIAQYRLSKASVTHAIQLGPDR